MQKRMRRTNHIGLAVALALVGAVLAGCGTSPAATPQPTQRTTVQPTPGPTPTEAAQPVTVATAAQARDAALAILAKRAPDQAPPSGLTWAERRTTPPRTVGGEGMEYSSGDWVVAVWYPVTSLEQVIYSVTVTKREGASSHTFSVDIDAFGNPAESASAGGQPTPILPTGTPGTPSIERLVSDNNAFAFALYQQLSSGAGNLFFSPYSISQALAMTYAGARGETEAQMAKALHFGLPQSQLHASFKALAEELAQRGKGAQGKDGQGFRLNIVNALWGQQGYDFLPEFLGLLSADYGAGMERVDFAQSEQARATINRWVEEQTESRIKDLIPPGALDALTRLVLTNAVYFNAAWATPFSESATSDGPFTLLDGSEVTVPMMRETESLGYAQGSGYQAVELPYDGGELSMVVLLPAKGQFEPFESSLDGAKLEAILGSISWQQVALSLPKFEFDSTFSLRDALSALGMPLAFTPNADFSGMSGRPELYITAVLHKAFVSVDETGTEAAAATAVIVGLTSLPAEPVEVTVDRPFLFLIRDKSGTILFLGRVLNPGA